MFQMNVQKRQIHDSVEVFDFQNWMKNMKSIDLLEFKVKKKTTKNSTKSTAEAEKNG